MTEKKKGGILLIGVSLIAHIAGIEKERIAIANLESFILCVRMCVGEVLDDDVTYTVWICCKMPFTFSFLNSATSELFGVPSKSTTTCSFNLKKMITVLEDNCLSFHYESLNSLLHVRVHVTCSRY